jgi:hypothetical protein
MNKPFVALISWGCSIAERLRITGSEKRDCCGLQE